jgi:hypothetical protein
MDSSGLVYNSELNAKGHVKTTRLSTNQTLSNSNAATVVHSNKGANSKGNLWSSYASKHIAIK